MPLTNANRLGQVQLKPGLIEAFPRRIQLDLVFPFVGVDGLQLDVATTGTFAEQLEVGQVISSSATALTSESPILNTNRQFGFKLYGTRFRVAYYDQDTIESPNNIKRTLLHTAKRQLKYAFYQDLIATLSESAFLATEMKKAGAGDTVVLRELNEAIGLISDNHGKPTAIMSTVQSMTDFLDTMDSMGKCYEYVETTWPDPIHGAVRRKIESFRGIPWYINDFSNGSLENKRIWIMVLGDRNDPNPGHGVTGIVPANRVGDMFVVRESTPDAQYVNVDVVFPAGFMLGSQGALAAYDYAIPGG